MEKAKTILIVDDDANVRATLSDILLEKRYKAIEADSGKSALDKVQREEINLGSLKNSVDIQA